MSLLRQLPRLFLALLFLSAGLDKAIDGQSFHRYFYALWPINELSSHSAWALQWALVSSEFTIGCLLLGGWGVRVAAYYSCTFLIVFTVLVAPGYAEKQCGCGWVANWITPEGTAGFVARNVALVVLAVWVGSNWRDRDGGSRIRDVLLGAALLAVVGFLGVEATQDTNADPHTAVANESVMAQGIEDSRSLISPSANRVEIGPPRVPGALVDATTNDELAGALMITGYVHDLEGRPIPGALVVDAMNPSDALSRTGRDGRFLLTVLRNAGTRLTARKVGLTAVVDYLVKGSTGQIEPILVMAESVRLAGRVGTAEDAPIREARLWLSPKLTTTTLNFRALDTGVLPSIYCNSDHSGEFVLPEAPNAPELFTLNVQADGYRPVELELPTAPEAFIRIEMEPATGAGELRGSVLLENGDPAIGATVVFGELNQCTTDTTGSFRLIPVQEPFGQEVAAMLKGFQSGTASVTQAMISSGEAIQVVLGGPALTISGHIVSANGEPKSGWLVGLTNGIPITTSSLRPRFAEQFEGSSDEHPSSADGHFVVDGLNTGSYGLYARDPNSGVVVIVKPTASGRDDLLIEVPDSGIISSFEAAVVTGNGTPVPGVRVEATVDLNLELGLWRLSNMGVTTTDMDGMFALQNIPDRHTNLTITGDQVFMPTAFSITDLDMEAPVELTVLARCRVAITLAGSEPASLKILDQDGNQWPIGLGAGFSGPELLLESGKVHHATFPDSARTVVLLRGGREFARHEISLLPGEQNNFEF